MGSVEIAYFTPWKREDTGPNVEDAGVIGTPFPLGLRGSAESVNYSLIRLEKSNIHFNQNHITNLLFTEYLVLGPSNVFVSLVQASSSC